MKNLTCRNSLALVEAEKEIRDLIPNPDLTRSEITHQALMLVASAPPAEDRILEITQKIRNLKERKPSNHEADFSAALAVKISDNDQKIMESVTNSTKKALSLEKPRSQFLLELLWWNLMESLQKTEHQQGPNDNRSEKENFNTDKDESLELIEKLTQILKANRGNSELHEAIMKFLSNIGGQNL